MTAPKPDLDAIKARLAKATPGPWATNRVLVTVGAPCRWRSFVVRPDVPPAYDIRVATPGDGTSKGDESPDADLIAHAPADLAALVAEVEDLREYLRAAEQAHLRHDAEAERLSDRLTSAEEELEWHRVTLAKINEIRNSIVGRQCVSWSEHVYPLVTALEEAGLTGDGYDMARAKAKAEVELWTAEARAPVEAERDAARELIREGATTIESLLVDRDKLAAELAEAMAALREALAKVEAAR